MFLVLLNLQCNLTKNQILNYGHAVLNYLKQNSVLSKLKYIVPLANFRCPNKIIHCRTLLPDPSSQLIHVTIKCFKYYYTGLIQPTQSPYNVIRLNLIKMCIVFFYFAYSPINTNKIEMERKSNEESTLKRDLKDLANIKVIQK